ncbi:diaminopimelate decarboxylase [Acidiluteibacter ferrifornacis]|uniref:Diaminopimelate decarboxylase n=1 Tax=Acidiluteibacter ferrifornacis TaxID=2692424 RepID=A0A6N9NHJ9_9FLAO|nr:diaminopimelate decarboxylase [Acidiluteibacter ferrifornacis]NBG65304.1 diaminopimelate decarboxylase [Acidiluteibacter ferrifornacis]
MAQFDLQKFKEIETPFFYYDESLLKETLKIIKSESDKHQFHVHYALKANANNRILELVKQAGLGADCVSGNEVLKAVELGFESNNIAFAGVGKSDKEINIGLDYDIFSFNCESLQELIVINELAEKRDKTARVALRINPNVNAKTHHYITTGLEENKFGINPWEFEEVLKVLEECNHIKLVGLHFHIGSQITDLDVFKSLCLRVNEIQEWFISKQILVEHINVGGGFGIDYENVDENPIADFAAFFQLFADFLEVKPSQQVHFELGRAVVAQCGSLISRVLYIKNGQKTNFAILDAGMTELIRPALYQSYHKIENITQAGAQSSEKYDVVGPICESSDCFGKAVVLPLTKRNDLIAIRSAGAYGEVMSSAYNLRDKAIAVYSSDLK